MTKADLVTSPSKQLKTPLKAFKTSKRWGKLKIRVLGGWGVVNA